MEVKLYASSNTSHYGISQTFTLNNWDFKKFNHQDSNKRTNRMKCLNEVSYKDCVGKMCKSKLSGDFKIVKYNDSKNVEVRFLKTGFETSATLGNIRNGKVKDPCAPSVCGVGILGTKYPSRVNDVLTKEYILWTHMLERCYSDSFKKKYPTYEGCEVSNNFKSYEYFYEWCHKQIGFGVEGWHLDKDLLIKSNKVYSETTCVFLPFEINSLLIKRGALRGEHLIGVSWYKRDKAFVAKVSRNEGQQEHLGYFNTELEAFNAYKTAKEAFVKEQANRWNGKIDIRAYNALMNYEVNIDD